MRELPRVTTRLSPALYCASFSRQRINSRSPAEESGSRMEQYKRVRNRSASRPNMPTNASSSVRAMRRRLRTGVVARGGEGAIAIRVNDGQYRRAGISPNLRILAFVQLPACVRSTNLHVSSAGVILQPSRLTMRTRLKVFTVLLILTPLYYWRILIGHQFSLLTGFEGANQAYAWYTFLARSLQSHASLLWDPYSFGGHPFVRSEE